MTLPNFLIIGAGKSGTTSLYRYLKQHADIYMSPIKEPRFFAYEEGERPHYRGPGDDRTNSGLITEHHAYEQLFAGMDGQKAAGEASILYLYSPTAAARIRRAIPQVRLIAVLRNPVERAYSHFLHLIREGREPLRNFSEALAQEEARIRDNWMYMWHYKQMGFYHRQLARYYQLFAPEQIRVYLFEDLNRQPVQVVRDIYRFLEVDDTFEPDTSIQHNPSGVPRSRVLHNFLQKQHPAKTAAMRLFYNNQRLRQAVSNLRRRNLVKPELPVEARRQLLAAYREDILALQDLLQRDLAHWLAMPEGRAAMPQE